MNAYYILWYEFPRAKMPDKHAFNWMSYCVGVLQNTNRNCFRCPDLVLELRDPGYQLSHVEALQNMSACKQKSNGAIFN
jgi:hypothetical protein